MVVEPKPNECAPGSHETAASLTAETVTIFTNPPTNSTNYQNMYEPGKTFEGPEVKLSLYGGRHCQKS